MNRPCYEITLIPRRGEPRMVNATRRGCKVTITRGDEQRTVPIRPLDRAKMIADDIKADSPRGRAAAAFFLAKTRDEAATTLAEFRAQYGVTDEQEGDDA